MTSQHKYDIIFNQVAIQDSNPEVSQQNPQNDKDTQCTGNIKDE